MPGNGRAMFSNPNQSTQPVNPERLAPSSIAPAPTSMTTPTTRTQVTQNTSGELSRQQQRYLEKGAPQRAKEASAAIIGDKGVVNDLPDDLWDTLGQYVVDGNIDLERTRSANQITDAVNTLKGRECMGKRIDDNFLKGLFSNLGGKGFDLSLADLFRCLVAELQNAGATFVNTVMVSNNKIIKDQSLDNLRGVTEVLDSGTKTAVPNYTDNLAVYKGSGSDKENHQAITETMSAVDPEWDQKDDQVNLDVYRKMSPDAKRAMENQGNDRQRMGAVLSSMYH